MAEFMCKSEVLGTTHNQYPFAMVRVNLPLAMGSNSNAAAEKERSGGRESGGRESGGRESGGGLYGLCAPMALRRGPAPHSPVLSGAGRLVDRYPTRLLRRGCHFANARRSRHRHAGASRHVCHASAKHLGLVDLGQLYRSRLHRRAILLSERRRRPVPRCRQDDPRAHGHLLFCRRLLEDEHGTPRLHGLLQHHLCRIAARLPS